MQSITEFLEDNKDTIIRFLTYNKFNIWTPEQISNKYCDESVYLDTHYQFAKITNAINIPNNDVILELEIVDENDFTSYNRKEYRLLSDIELSKLKCDQEMSAED